MEILKKILAYIATPFHRFGSRGFADHVVKYINKNKYLFYLISFIITLVIIILSYIFIK